MNELNILSALMLKLDNEKLLFEESNNFLKKLQKDIFKKYKIGIKINKFLCDTREDSKEELIEDYNKFKIEKVSTNSTIGDYFAINFDSITDEGFEYMIGFSENVDYNHPEKANCKLYQLYSAFKSNGEKTITIIVQYFEEFLSLFLHMLIEQKPEAFLYDKQIRYSQIIETDIEKLKEDILNQEVRNYMYDVISTLEKIDNVCKFNLSNNEVFEKYKEIDMHRNIIVHNGGIVNEEYNRRVSKKYRKELKTVIKCNPELIDEDIIAIEKFAFLLSYLQGKNEEDWDTLESVAFESLCSEKWRFCEFAYDLIRKDKSISNEMKTLFTANYLLSRKNIEGLEKTREEIEKFDVSGMNTYYALSKDLLLEENDEIVKKLEVVFNKEIKAYFIKTWPIFSEFRKTVEYESFVKKHSEYFSAIKDEFVNNDEDDIDNSVVQCEE